MSENQVIKNLKVVLANNYALFLKTQNYHWNITGPNFKPLHSLFEEQYDDLFTANDEIAERIRSLGEKVPATFTIFNHATSIKDGNETSDAVSMVKELAHDQEILIESLKETFKAAQDADDEVTIGFVVDRMSVHEKAAWILKNSI
jgi:starvation-inducible DNA-binding protein